MTPRRKKGDEAEGLPEEATPADPPKRKSPSRAKKASPIIPSAGAPDVLVVSSPPAAKPPESRPMPVRMKVEPVGLPAEKASEDADLWKPEPRRPADLSTPPSILLQRKRVPAPEVEDILEEPEQARVERQQTFIRPDVRTGLYRKIGIAFAVAALIMAAGVGYVLLAHASVIVHPTTVEASTERTVTVGTQPSGDEIPGEIQEVTVAGEKTMTPAGAGTAAAGMAVKDAQATGSVTIYNGTSNPITLVATTRLLSPDGILFRLKVSVMVPARGHAKAAVYADKPGASGDIGPTTFTIPGLPAALQKAIYAKSDQPMTGGVIGGGSGSVAGAGAASQQDLDTLEKSLRDELMSQAEAELAAKSSAAWTGQAVVADTMSRFVNAAAGEPVDQVVMRITIRVRQVSFDKDKALAPAIDDLTRGLPPDKELVSVDRDHAEFTVDRADPKAGTAAIHVVLKGLSSVSLKSFDANRLKGLDLAAVQAYFKGIDGVDHVDVRFTPPWPKRMPDLADHITFEIAQ